MLNNIVETDLRIDDKLTRYLTKHGTLLSILKLSFFLLKKKLLSIILHTRPSYTDSKQHIAFEIAGGLGDFCMHAKYISSFYTYFGDNLIIDIVTETNHLEILKLIFNNCSYINKITDAKRKNIYDLYIRLVRFPEIKYYVPKRLDQKLLNWVVTVFEFLKKNRALLSNDFVGRYYSEICGHTRENQADIGNILNLKNEDSFIISPPVKTNEILSKFELQPDNYLIIQTGPGIAFKEYSDVRKWPLENYEKLVELIKAKYPNIKIVQIGFSYQEKVPGIDINLIGKTTDEELLSLLSEAKLLISQEGGCVIARHFLSRKISCVLFGPTSKKFFGFPENINLSSECCQGCEWVIRSWIEGCIKTGNNPECMYQLKPEKVFLEVENAIK